MVWRSLMCRVQHRRITVRQRSNVSSRGAALRALVFALAVLANSVSAHAVGPVADVQVISEETHGRIVLTFPGSSLLPEHKTRIANGVFVVEFSSPVSIDVQRVPVDLTKYVTVARSDPDGLGVRFALAQGTKVNTIEAGERLFIDFLPHGWQGMPPNLPPEVVAELARRAEEAIKKVEAAERLRKARELGAEVKLRVGEHPTFTRFVFGWNLPFTNSLERDGNSVTLTFDHVADLDLTEVKNLRPKGLKDITTKIDDARLSVIIELDKDVDVRGFLDGTDYVVDLTPPAEAPDAVNAAVQDAISKPEGGAQRISSSTSPLEEQERPVAANIAKAVPDPSRETRGNPEAPQRNKPQRAKFIRTQAQRIGETIRISFPFSKPVASAVFTRGNSLWIAFDTPVPIDTRTIHSALAGLYTDITMKRSGLLTTIRIDLNKKHLTTIGADGTSWVVTIGDMLLEPSRPLQVDRKVQPNGDTVLTVDIAGYASIHEIVDPVVGDKLHVVTALGPPRGLLKPQRFAELETLPSVHGIAIVGFTDDFRILGKDEDQIVLDQGNRGLSLSRKAAAAGIDLGFSKKLTNGQRAGYIDLNRDINSLGELAKALSTLRNQVVDVDEEGRNGARQRLAKFYLNQGMPFEALGLIKVIEENDAQIRSTHDFLIMRAAAQTLANRTESALSVLRKRELSSNPHAALWRTIAEASRRNWRSARKAAPVARSVIGEYPTRIQSDYILAAAESAIELNDFGAAAAQLAEISVEKLEPAQAARFNLLRGRVADVSGHAEEALTRLDQAASLEMGEPSVQAEYRSLRLRYRDGLMTAAKVIDRLDAIAAHWRGDETELKVLRFLAQLRVQTGDYRKAFEAMKSAVHAAPNADTARLIHEEMTAVFASLFLEDKANVMQPVDALSLYYDFREMTPVGRQGDEMVRKLAARLVDIDLLDQATELLQHQVDNRLKGAARAQIAADLASIHLLNDKPELALAVLSKTRQAELPHRLDRQRRLIEARAMSETGRVEQAIDLVRNLNDLEVGRLRANIYWRAGRWQKAGEALERLYGARWSEPLPLNERERIDVLKAAIAYSRADDQIGLDRLNSKYISKMSDSPHARAFDIVTRPIEAKGVDFLDVARQIAATDTLDAFLEEYRKQYMTAAISPENSDAADAPQPPQPDAVPDADPAETTNG